MWALAKHAGVTHEKWGVRRGTHWWQITSEAMRRANESEVWKATRAFRDDFERMKREKNPESAEVVFYDPPKEPANSLGHLTSGKTLDIHLVLKGEVSRKLMLEGGAVIHGERVACSCECTDDDAAHIIENRDKIEVLALFRSAGREYRTRFAAKAVDVVACGIGVRMEMLLWEI
jgi:hypothetical protein